MTDFLRPLILLISKRCRKEEWYSMNKHVRNAKDITLKNLEAYDDVFCDIVNFFCSSDTFSIQPEDVVDLHPNSQLKIDGGIHEQERDVVKLVKNSAAVQIAIIGLENETKADKGTILKILGYDGAEYKAQYSRRKAQYTNEKRDKSDPFKGYVPVITLVLYFGTNRSFSGLLKLSDALNLDDVPKEIMQYFHDYSVHVINVPMLTQKELERFKSDFRIVADYMAQTSNCKKYVPSEQTMIHADETLKFLSVVSKDERYLIPIHKGKKVKNMCETLDFVENRGFKHGFEYGDKHGFERGDKHGFERGDKHGFERGDKHGFERGDKHGFKRGEEHGIQLGRQQQDDDLELAAVYLRETGREDELIRLLEKDFRKMIIAECKERKENV